MVRRRLEEGLGRRERCAASTATAEVGLEFLERRARGRRDGELSLENWPAFSAKTPGENAGDDRTVHRRPVFVLSRSVRGFHSDIFRETNGDGEKKTTSTTQRTH